MLTAQLAWAEKYSSFIFLSPADWPRWQVRFPDLFRLIVQKGALAPIQSARSICSPTTHHPTPNGAGWICFL